MTKNKINLFVYGSLMKQAGNVLMDQYGIFIDYGVIKGSLYHLGAYPGVKLNKQNIVQGEVWEISKSVVRTLDKYEGYPLLYNREKTKAKLKRNSKVVDVMVYTYNYAITEDQFIIKNGDWMSVDVIHDMGTFIV